MRVHQANGSRISTIVQAAVLFVTGSACGQKSQTYGKGLVSGLVIVSHSCFLRPQEHVQSGFDDQVYGGSGMIWARMLAYITGTVDQELLLSPKRKQTTSWKDFIRAHMAVSVATDFFTVEVPPFIEHQP